MTYKNNSRTWSQKQWRVKQFHQPKRL